VSDYSCSKVLPDLRHTSHFYDWRFPLPLRESVRLLTVGVSTSKHFTIFIENLGFKMMVLAASIAELGEFMSDHMSQC